MSDSGVFDFALDENRSPYQNAITYSEKAWNIELKYTTYVVFDFGAIRRHTIQAY